MATQPVKIGIIGCGNICNTYFENAKRLEAIEVAACADIIPERAEAKAQEHGVPKVCSVDDLLADPEIRIVVNLTIPAAHFEVSMAAVQAGKSAYGEKPLTVTRDEGRRLLDAARERGVLVGSAPDTFLGGGIQTCRKLIDDGWIGEPVAANAFMTCRGHESWHPDPEFYYKVGGGPMFDMGPYYLTALVCLLGPIQRVSGSARITFPERTITSQPKHGAKITVDTPTHIAGTMDFANGAVGTIVTSFDVWRAELPRIEIHGTEGSLSVPDPNGFGGPVRVFRPGSDDWKEIPLLYGAKIGRGMGVADMACALRSGRPHRASGALAYHVLDVMHAFLETSEEERHIHLESVCEQPAILPLGLREGELDE